MGGYVGVGVVSERWAETELTKHKTKQKCPPKKRNSTAKAGEVKKENRKKNIPRSERKGKIAKLKLCCSHGTE